MSKEDDEFERAVLEGLVPKVADSYVCVSLVPDDPKKVDVKFAVELGVMIMLDKPILIVVAPGTEPPAKLKAVADEIVYADLKAPGGPEQVAHAAQAFAKKIEGND